MASRFKPSATFAGALPGYVFKSGELGTGYYAEFEDDDNVSRKRKRAPGPEPGPQVTSSSSAESADARLERLLGAEMPAEADTLDERGLRSMLIALEKAINRNQILRLKHPDQPTRFMESEVDLSEAIQRLASVAAAPSLYPSMVAARAVPSLLGLLTHENTDVSIAVLALLDELLEGDTLNEAAAAQADAEGEAEAKDAPPPAMGTATGAGALQLVDTLLSAQLLELLTQNLARLDEGEEEDAAGVYHTLSVLESLLELWPARVGSRLAKRTGVLLWLLHRVKQATFNQNKLYAAEVLSILLSSSSSSSSSSSLSSAAATESVNVAQLVGSVGGENGVELLLEALAVWRRVENEPAGADEEECAENIASALRSALMVGSNQLAFRQAEGFELLLRMVRGRGKMRSIALGVIDYALLHSRPNVLRFIDVGGLKAIFPALMGKNHRRTPTRKEPGTGTSNRPKGRKVKLRAAEEQELEEHVLSSLCSLLVYSSIGDRPTTSDGAVDQTGVLSDHFRRLMAKFLEDSALKLDRLIELHAKYEARVAAVESRFAAQRRERMVQRQRRREMRRTAGDALDATEEEEAEEEEEEASFRAMEEVERLGDGGLFSLQRISTSLAVLCVHSEALCAAAVLKIHQQRRSFSRLVACVRECGETMDASSAHGADLRPYRTVTISLSDRLEATVRDKQQGNNAPEQE